MILLSSLASAIMAILSSRYVTHVSYLDVLPDENATLVGLILHSLFLIGRNLPCLSADKKVPIREMK